MADLVRSQTGSALGRYVDSLIQAFEDRRTGLSDAALAEGEQAAVAFFLTIFEAEKQRLRGTIGDLESHLTPEAQDALFHEVSQLLVSVVIPSYARTARRFTLRERNDFYLSPDPKHGFERLGFAIGGILVGLFVVAAPFIPLWSKEWVAVFMLVGLLFPEIRRWMGMRSYEGELNRLVSRADRELSRLDGAYLMRGEEIPELAEVTKESDSPAHRAARSLGDKNGQGQG